MPLLPGLQSPLSSSFSSVSSLFQELGSWGEGMGEATRGAEMEELQQRANNALESEETEF